MNATIRGCVRDILLCTRRKLNLHYTAHDIHRWSEAYHGGGGADEIVAYCKRRVKEFEEIHRHVELLNA